MNAIRLIAISAMLTAFSGCMNIAASLQPEDKAVKEERRASDCIPIIFGFSYGTATVEEALTEEVHLIGQDGLTRAILFDQGRALAWARKIYGAEVVLATDASDSDGAGGDDGGY